MRPVLAALAVLVTANRFRTTRYANDQSNQPSLDHDKSAEPTELDAPESLGRVCEPYALVVDRAVVAALAAPVTALAVAGPDQLHRRGRLGGLIHEYAGAA